MDIPDFRNLSRQDQIKLGVAGAALVLSLIILIYYFFLSGPSASPPDAGPPPTETKPNMRTP